jgi:uncharacterized membrane protein YgcG
MMMFWILGVGSALAGQAKDLAEQAPQSAHVFDAAMVLPLAEGSQLEQQAASMEEEFGVWIQFVTVPQVDEGSALDLALSLSESFGLNQSAEQNDVLVLLVSEPRKIEVVVGLGLRPVFSKFWEDEMMLSYVYPEVERGQGASALVRWMHKVELRIRLLGPDARYGATAPRFGWVPPPEPADNGPVFRGIAALLFAGGLGAWVVFVFRRRFCFNHPFPVLMYNLSETADDAYLSAQQRREERFLPRRHEVLCCHFCGQTRVLSVELVSVE